MHKITHKKNIIMALVVLGVSALIFLLGSVSGRHSTSQRDVAEQNRYPFLANRLFSAQKNDMIVNFTQLREVMKARYTEKNIAAGVYFEYLPTGASIGVNDQMEVKIGSLTKVPAVMAVYKQIEKGALDLDSTLVVSQNNIDKNFGDLWKEGAGKELSLRAATELTLKKSDNTAASTLASTLPEGALSDVFDQLDLPKTRSGPFPTMSPKSYTSVFRNLYLATYLNYENSNLILQELSESDFKINFQQE